MSIDYSCAVVVGLPFSSFEDEEQLEKWADDCEIDSFAPYYDAPRGDCLYGFSIGEANTYSFAEFSPTEEEKQEAVDTFKKLTGLEPKVYVTLHVS